VHTLVELVEVGERLCAEDAVLAAHAHLGVVLLVVGLLLYLAALDMQPFVEVGLEVLEGLEAVRAVFAYHDEAVQLAIGRIGVVGVHKFAYLAGVDVHLAVEVVEACKTLGAVHAALLDYCVDHG